MTASGATTVATMTVTMMLAATGYLMMTATIVRIKTTGDFFLNKTPIIQMSPTSTAGVQVCCIYDFLVYTNSVNKILLITYLSQIRSFTFTIKMFYFEFIKDSMLILEFLKLDVYSFPIVSI